MQELPDVPADTGASLPLGLVPDVVWQQPSVPTMEGQSIIKNLVLIGAALYLGAKVREE